MAIPRIIQSITRDPQARIHHLQHERAVLEGNCNGSLGGEIWHLTVQLTTGNRFVYSAEKIEKMQQRLKDAELERSQTRTSLDAEIQTLQQQILNDNAVAQNTIQDIIGCPLPLLELIDQYV